MRSLTGIMRDTGLNDIKAAKSLTKPCNLAPARKSSKDDKDWWWLTTDGRTLAKELAIG